MWNTIYDKLLTNNIRHRHKIYDSNLYPKYQMYPETITHSLKDCEDVKYFRDIVIVRGIQ